jgi:hypothetical protein
LPGAGMKKKTVANTSLAKFSKKMLKKKHFKKFKSYCKSPTSFNFFIPLKDHDNFRTTDYSELFTLPDVTEVMASACLSAVHNHAAKHILPHNS